MGQGFGLGFAVRTMAGHNPLAGSIGNYYWTGAWGTTFWVHPPEKLIAIHMIQTPSESGGPYRRAFRNLVYQALTGRRIFSGLSIRGSFIRRWITQHAPGHSVDATGSRGRRGSVVSRTTAGKYRKVDLL